MKLIMREIVRDLDGDPIEQDAATVKAGVKPSAVTLRHVLVTALSAAGPDYAQETPEQKFKRGMLAIQAHTQDVLELTAEDAAMCKRCVAATYAPLVVYRAHLALDGNDMNPELSGRLGAE